MSKIKIVMILGVLSAITPLSGFPEAFRSLLVFVFGFAVAIIAYLIYRERQTFVGPVDKTDQSFVEGKDNGVNNPQQ